jgi:hypothetical protein
LLSTSWAGELICCCAGLLSASLFFRSGTPRLKAVVQLNVPRSRSEQSGARHVWRFVPAAQPGLMMGPRHAEVKTAFRALLQANPVLSDAYFPE